MTGSTTRHGIGGRGVTGGPGLIRCEDHLALLLSADEDLGRVLSAVPFAPLARLRRFSRTWWPRRP